MIRFLRRWRIYAKLYALSRQLSRIPASADELLNDTGERAREQLFKLIESDEACSLVLKKYGASRQMLEALYEELLEAGAGQCAGSKYIPCFALAEPWTLDYLLRRRRQSPTGQIGVSEAFEVVVFYQDGTPLQSPEE